MIYLLLIPGILFISAQHIISKQYTVKTKNGNMLMFSFVRTLFALLFFVVCSGGKLNFNTRLLPYSAAFALTYGAATVGSIYSIKSGPLSISSLIMSYSLIIPTFYGIIFMNEPVRINTYIGIALLMISLFLINIKKEDTKFSAVWIIWLIIGFLGNGLCSAVQKIQQITFDGAYKNEFMIESLILVCGVLFIMTLRQNGGKKNAFKECFGYASLNGIANGIVNLLIMVLVTLMPGAVLYPSVSAGGIIVTFIVSLAVYKERFTKMQFTGYIIGIISVILLNL